jgi:tripartite-type tricarboxylate transporter receptor subunit TctC
MKNIASVVAALISGVSCMASAAAQISGDQTAGFFHGKQITVIVGYPPGGGYDVYARLLARYMGDHLPGRPSMVVENMPGGGSMIAANYLYNRASKDGTVFGMFAGGMALAPLFGNSNAAFDSRKFGWLGSMNQESSLCLASAKSGITSIDSVLRAEMTVGTASSTGTSYTFPTVDNKLVGTKFKLVSGYEGSSGVMLALERGEVQGMCGLPLTSIQSARPQWLEKKQVDILLQETTRRDPKLPDVPTVLDLAKDENTKRIIELIYGWQIMGRPFTAPSGVSAERIAALRKAFEETIHSGEFLSEAKKVRADVDLTDAKLIQDFLDRAYDTPEALVKRATEVQGGSGVE